MSIHHLLSLRDMKKLGFAWVFDTIDDAHNTSYVFVFGLNKMIARACA